MPHALRPPTLLIAATLFTACTAPAADTPNLRIEVLSLTLPGFDEACVDLAVSTPSGLVWRRGDPTRTRGGESQLDRTTPASADTTALCSARFGNGVGGDLSYVGPCDATQDSDLDVPGVQNDITLHVDGLYKDGVDLGDWRDPCPAGCVVAATCRENTDTLVTFDLTVMRDARQGFMDIAIDLEDVFCSAKLDTCYESNTPIRLLHGADDGRDWTAVFGFACTGGVGANADLYMGSATVTCGSAVFELEVGALGNQSLTRGANTLHYGVYRGEESLRCEGGSCEKLYWNLAVSLDDLVSFGGGDCTLEVAATVASPGVIVDGVLATEQSAYPFVEVSVPLTTAGVATCQRHGLGDDGGVTTRYRGELGGLGDAAVMCVRFDGTAVVNTGGEGCPGTPCPAPSGPFEVEVSAVDGSGQTIAGLGGEVKGPDLVWTAGPLVLPASLTANTGTTMTLASRFGGLEREVTLEVRPRQLVRVDVLTGAITRECAEVARVVFVHTVVEVIMDAQSFSDEALPAVPFSQFAEATPARCLDSHGSGQWRPVPFSVWRAPGVPLAVHCHWGFPVVSEGGLAARGELVVTPSTTTSIDPRVQVLEASFDTFPPAALTTSSTPGVTRVVARFEPIAVEVVPEDLSGNPLPHSGDSEGVGGVFDYYSLTPGFRYGRSPNTPWTYGVPLPDGGVVYLDVGWGGLGRSAQIRLWKNRPATLYALGPTGTDTLSTPGDLADPETSVRVHVRFQPIEVRFRGLSGPGSPYPLEFFYGYTVPDPAYWLLVEAAPATYPHRARGGRSAFQWRVGTVLGPVLNVTHDIDTTYTVPSTAQPGDTFVGTPSPGVTEVQFVF